MSELLNRVLLDNINKDLVLSSVAKKPKDFKILPSSESY